MDSVIFPWTVVPSSKQSHDNSIDIEKLLDQVKKDDATCISSIKNILKQNFSYIHPNLKNMLQIAMCHFENTANQRQAQRIETLRVKSAKSCFVEIVAGLQYSTTNKKVGLLNLLKRKLATSDVKPKLISFIKKYCADCLSSQRYMEQNAWFKLRVACMDFYALTQLVSLQSSCDLIVYYAGCAHTRATEDQIVDFLDGDEKDLMETDRDMRIRDELAYYASSCSLEHISSLRLGKNCVLLLLGENHSRTHIRFAKHVIEFLQSQCNSQQKIAFLIEKHIFNKKDILQQKLSCNQKNAIHTSRCHPFFHTAQHCKSLLLLPVDNRHFDLGFLRTEIMDLWNHDEEYKKEAILFQREAYVTLLQFLDLL